MRIYDIEKYSFASLEDLSNEFKKKELLKVFSKLTEKQQLFFFKLYPDGIEEMAPQKYDWAYQQIMRTIINNKKNTK